MSEDPDLQTRPSLLARLRDPHDDATWRAFVDLYGPLVYGYCRRRGLQDADAGDVAQEVLMEVARCIRTFEYQPERGRFRDWLGTITRRRLAHFWEKQKRAAAVVGGTLECGDLDGRVAPPQDAEWTDAFNAQVLRVALERARPHFEAATWQVFERVWLHNQPAPVVAAELEMPIDLVYKAKSRVLKRLESEVLLLAEDRPQDLTSG